MSDLQKLRRTYPHLTIVEKTRVKDKGEFLRWQALEVGTEDVMLPAIYKVRAEVNATVVFRKLIAFGETKEALADALRTYYAPAPEEEKEAA